MANAHRRRNCFKSISINDKKLDKEAKIKEGLADAFQNFLLTSSDWRPTLLEITLREIRPEDATKLEEAFLEEEIWNAVSGLNNDKAPGPDGFPLAFWSFSWDFVKNEVLGFSRSFTNIADLLKI